MSLQLHSWYLQRFLQAEVESRGIRLEDEGTKRTTTPVLNIIQKAPETVIHLKVEKSSGGPAHEGAGRKGTHLTYLLEYCTPSAPLLASQAVW